jgi:hypothetical protein
MSIQLIFATSEKHQEIDLSLLFEACFFSSHIIHKQFPFPLIQPSVTIDPEMKIAVNNLTCFSPQLNFPIEFMSNFPLHLTFWIFPTVQGPKSSFFLSTLINFSGKFDLKNFLLNFLEDFLGHLI